MLGRKQSSRSNKRRNRPVVEGMEPRILYSADGLSALLDADHTDALEFDAPPVILTQSADTLEQHAAPPSPEPGPAPAITTELVVIDSRVADYQKLVDDIQARSTTDAWFEIIVLNQIDSGISQITELLAQRHDVSAVHIVSHGADGGVQLGASVVDGEALKEQAASLALWRSALTVDADILVYGCDVAAGSSGESFVNELARLTGADVAASTDLTGDARLGGDWELEYQTGHVDVASLFDHGTPEWSGVLAIASVGTNTSAQTTGATSLAWTHTVSSGSNLALIVGVAVDGLGANVTSVTFGSASLTQVGRATGNHAVELWSLVNPTVGANTVTISFGGTTAAAGGAMTFSGVDQATPTGTFAGAAGTGTTSSVTVSSGTGDLVIDIENWDNDPSGYAVGAGQTQQWTATNASIRGVSTTEAGAASVIMSSTVTSSAQWEIGAVSIRAANAAPTATNLSAADTYTEDTTLNLTDIVASDVDSPNITATLTLSNVAAGSLSTATSGAVTSIYNALTGVWTASGAIADVNTLLAGVTFSPASNFNNNFTIATSVSDGVAAAITGSKAMTGTAVNDAPVLDAGRTPALNSTNEDAGAPVGAVGTLVSTLVDFASPSGQVDNVTDPDGPGLGIAITAANTASGTWWYSINNGSSWNALGTVSNTNSRLLADDGNTRLYFQPNANFNGTIANAITFRAWDQFSGSNGGTVTLAAASTVLDQFTAVSYAGNNGTVNWNGSWQEAGEADGTGSGMVLVNAFAGMPSNSLQIETDFLGRAASRAVDLSTATSATLSFDYIRQHGGGTNGAVAVQVFNGSAWTTLQTFTINATDATAQSFSADIGAYANVNTQIRFIVTGSDTLGRLHVDNVQVSYTHLNVGGSTAFSAATDTAGLTVSAINDLATSAPITLAPVAENSGTRLITQAELLANAADIDGPGPLTATGLTVSSGSGSLVDNGNGTWSYTPALNDDTLVVFSYGVSDGIGAGGGSATLDITPSINNAPVGVADSYSVNEDSSLTANWWDNDWTRRSAITLSGNTFPGATNLTDFPVLIKLNAGNIDYSLTQNAGQDLRFVDANGTLLAYEIEKWNEAGDSYVWVRVPQVDATGSDYILMYYGNAAAAAGQNTGAVWSNSYSAVYHMGSTGTAIVDSTGNGITGVATNGPVVGTGQVGDDRVFDGINDYVNLGSNRSFTDGASAVTYSTWVNPASTAGTATEGIISTSINNGGVTTGTSRFAIERVGANLHVIVRGDDATSFVADTTSNPLAAGVWKHIAVTVDLVSDTVLVYVDGVLQPTTSSGSLPGTAFPNSPSASNAIAGADDGTGLYFNGQIDEMRVAKAARSAAWVQAEYLNMTNSFVTVGAAVAAPAANGVLGNDSDDGTLLSAVLVSGPSHASSFTLNPDGTFNYTPVADYAGADSFVYRATDGTLNSADTTVSITINPVNDAPTATIVPVSYAATEQVALTLHGTGLSIADVDAGAAAVRATVSVTSGILNTTAGTTGVTISGSGTASITLDGTLTQINNLLAGNLSGTLTFTANGDTPAASATLTLTASDLGNTGTGGTLTGNDTATINITAVSDAPVNSVPGAQVTNEDTAMVFSSGNGNQISISDPDVGGGQMEVTITATNGTLTLSGTGGLTFVNGNGTSNATMTFWGTVANINAALNGLIFTPASDYNGGAVLTLSSLDSTLLSLKTDGNLQGWYEFSGNANDTSPGTLQNATLFNGAVLTTDATRGQVLALDGVNDYADLSGSTGDYAGFTQGTISGWIKATGTFETIFSISDTADTGSYASLFLGASGYLTFEVMENGVMQLAVYRSSAAINDGNWHHVAVTVGATGNSLYVDGQLATGGQLTYDTGNSATQRFFSNVTSLDSMAIGRNQDSGGGKWYTTGSLDDVRIYDRVLSSADVANLANDLQLTDTDSVGITVSPVNDAPTAAITPVSYAATEQVALTLHGTGLSIADVDAGAAAVRATVSVTSGILTAAAGTTGVTVTGSGTNSVTLDGTLTQINNLLAGNLSGTLTYTANSDTPAVSATLTLTASDLGNTGTGGTLTGNDTAAINITAVNDAPTATIVPASYAATEQVVLTLHGTGLSIADVDAGAAAVRATVSVVSGIINAGTGTTGVTVTGSGTNSVTLDGTLTQINNLLAGNFSGTLTYIANSDTPAASDTLTLTASDLGNTGTGGTLTGNDTAIINITALNDAPTATIVPVSYAATEQVALTLHGTGLSIADVDAGSAAVRATVSVTSGILTAAAGITGVTVTGSGTNSVTLDGNLSQINNLLAGNLSGTLTYTANSDTPAASDTLTLTASDLGNTGSGGTLTGNDTATINITAVNDAPTAIIVPVSYAATEQVALSLHGTGLSIADLDAGAAPVRASLTVVSGIINAVAGTTGVSLSGNGSNIIILDGTLTQINDLLAGNLGGTLTYTANSDTPAASDTLTLTASDLGSTGSGGTLTGNDTATINITAVNDAPVNIVPGPQATGEDTALVFSTVNGNLMAVSDVDLNGNAVRVTLTATNGVLTLATTNNLAFFFGDGVGDASMSFQSTLADVNAALDGLIFQPTANFTGAASVQIVADDQGFTGGGAQTDSDTVAITVGGVNDAPTATIVPASYAATEQVALTLHGTGLSIADVDAGGAAVRATLSVTSGILTATAGTTGVTVTGSGTATVVLDGTLIQINSLLSGNLGGTLTYTANSDTPPASDALTLTASDLGNTGSGGTLTGNDTAIINIAAVNDAPTATIVPVSYAATEQVALILHGTGLSMADVDAGAAAVRAIVSVTSGILNVAAGTTGVTLGGSGTATVTLDGTLTQINDLLAGNLGGTLTYTANSDAPAASDTLTLTASDLGNTGSGGTLTGNDTATINITAVNDAPTATIVPVSYAATEQAALTLHGTGLSIADIDAGAAAVRATVSVVSGVINTTAGTTGVTISGDGTNTVTLDGTLTQINNLLAGNLGATLSYIAASDTPAAIDTLTLTANDLGNSGTGGTLTGNDTAIINITAVNDAPVNAVPGAQTVSEDTPLAIAGINIGDIDVGGAGLTSRLTVSNGVLNVSLAGGATISAGANSSSTLTLAGTLAQINAALATVTYQGNLNFNGADTLQIVTNDLGNTGAGGALSDTDTVAITVSAANDAPLATVPGVPYNATEQVALDLKNTGIFVSDAADGNAGVQTLILTVGQGTLNVTAGSSGVTIFGSGTSGVSITGSISQLNDLLNTNLTSTITYINTSNNPLPSTTLNVQIHDGGNVGAGGPLFDSRDVTINVAAVNDAPVNVVPGPRVVNEDTSFTVGGLAVTDPDAGSATTELTVANGTLNVNLASGATIIAGANGSSTLTLSGTLAQINGALATLTYQGNANFNGIDNLQIVTNDLGNTGSGGPLTDTDNVAITVNPVNDAPVNTVPGSQTVAEDALLAIGGLSVNDVDGNLATTQLSVASGTLNVSLVGGAAIGAGANGSSTLTLSGTQAQINAALATLTYQGNPEFSGADSLIVQSSDGSGATDSDTVAITVTGQNDAPVNSVPGAQTVAEDTPITIAGLSVSDVDGNLATTQLTVGNGTLTVNLAGGAAISGGASGSNTLTLAGTQAQINAALATLSYQGNLNFNGADTLTVLTSDAVGASDTDVVALAVTAVNDAPLNVVPGAQTVNEDTALVISGLGINDVDGSSATTQLTVGNGTLNVSLAGGASLSAGANNSNTLTLSGTQAQINAALATLSYQGNLNFNGSDTLQVVTNDLGNTGSGGAQSDTDTVAITVNAVNDAPSLVFGEGDKTFTEGALAVMIDALANVSDIDSLNFDAGALAVSISANASVDDRVELLNTGLGAGQIGVSGTDVFYSGTLIGTQAGGIGASPFVVTFNANADATAVREVMRNIRFWVAGDAPLTATRTIDVVLTDGDGGTSATATKQIAVVGVNDAPIITPVAPDITFVEGSVPLVIDALGTVVDADSANFDSGAFSVSVTQNASVDDRIQVGNFGTGAGQIGTTGSDVTYGGVVIGTFSGGGSGADPLVVTLNSNATQAAVQELYRSIQFGNVSENPSTATREVTFSLTDGDGGSAAPQTKLVYVNAVNDAPVNTVPGAQTVNEDTALAIGGLSITDADIGAASATTRLTVSNGTLNVSLAGGASISAGANGSSTLTLSGTQAQINAALATVIYQGNLDFNGIDTLQVVTNDLGNTGAGGPLADTDTVAITVNPVNDAPVNTVPGAQTVAEDTPAAISGLSVNDVDGNLATTRLAVSNGTLAVSLAGGASIGAGANGSSTLTLSGTLAQINAALATLTYQGNLNFNGVDTLQIVTSDLGNSGSGGAQSDIDTVTINVTAVNDAPAATVPGVPYNAIEQTVLSLKNTGISVADVDGGLGVETLLLSVGQGSLIASAGGSGVVIAGSGTSDLSITGTLAQLNDFLNTNATSALGYVNNLDAPAASTNLAVQIHDGGNIGAGGPLFGSASVAINITALNDAPVNTLPGPQTVAEDTPIAITGISIGDVDAGGAAMQTQLTVSNGSLSVSLAGGASISAGANGGSTFTLGGTRTQINAALSTLIYQGNPDFNGADTLQIVTSDLGNTGTGGALIDTDTLAITVNPVNDAPVNSVPGPQAVSEDTPLSITGLSVNDVDGNLAATQLTVANGVLTVNLAGGATIGAGANGSNTLTLAGTQTQINAALAALTYQGNLNFNGTDVLTVLSRDSSGAAANSTVAINVTPVNDAPTNSPITLPAMAEDSGSRLITQAELLANAADVDGPALSVTRLGIASGSGSLADNGNGTWTYTPALNDDSAVAFSYDVSDGSLTAVGSASLDLTPVNDPAVIAGTLTGTVVEAGGVGNATINIPVAAGNLTAADVDNAPDTFVAQNASGTYGSFELAIDGAWRYTLNNGNTAVEALNSGATLTDSFIVQSADGTSQVVIVTVNGANDIAIISGPGLNEGAPAAVTPKITLPPPDTVQFFDRTAPSAATTAESAAPTQVLRPQAQATDVFDALGNDEPARRGLVVSSQTALILQSGMGFISRLALAARLDDASLVFAGYDFGEYTFQLGRFNLLQQATGRGIDNGAVSYSLPEYGGATGGAQEGFNVQLSTRAAGISVTLGIAAWALRSGGLLAAMLSTLPAWRQMDLLPILGDADKRKGAWPQEDDEAAREERALDRMLGTKAGAYRV